MSLVAIVFFSHPQTFIWLQILVQKKKVDVTVVSHMPDI